MEYRIYGPPGTGKTAALTVEVERAVEEYGDQVMVASFTRAAAKEIGSRDLPLPDEHVGTLHAMAFRALGRPKIAEARVKEWNGQSRWQLSGETTGALDEGPAEMGGRAEGDALLSALNTVRARREPRERWPLEVQAFESEWRQWKLDNDYYDFTDLIERALTLVPYAPGIPKVGIFDEAQDFTALELALARQWAGHMEYAVFAGDDDQALYGFKGATPEAFIQPELPREQVRFLDVSHRLPCDLQLYADGWITSRVTERQPKPWRGRDGTEGATGSVRVEPSLRYRDGAAVVDAVEAAVADGSSAMVIGACGYMLYPVIAELRKRGLAFHNPYRRTRADWNPLIPPKQGQVTTWQRILEWYDPLWTAGKLRRVLPLLRKRSIADETAIDEVPSDMVLSMDQIEAVFGPENMDAVLTRSGDWLRANMLASKAKPAEYPLQLCEQRGREALHEQPRIQVGTIHSVKGGSADHVFLFPDVSMAAGRAEDRDPVSRLMYVGLTRAFETVTLCGPSTRVAVQWPEPVV